MTNNELDKLVQESSAPDPKQLEAVQLFESLDIKGVVEDFLDFVNTPDQETKEYTENQQKLREKIKSFIPTADVRSNSEITFEVVKDSFIKVMWEGNECFRFEVSYHEDLRGIESGLKLNFSRWEKIRDQTTGYISRKSHASGRASKEEIREDLIKFVLTPVNRSQEFIPASEIRAIYGLS